MQQNTLDLRQPESTEDHRRAARIRKVRPVAFASAGSEGDASRRTVTANVSRGGMLLVSRKDRFPPAGVAVTVMPYDEQLPLGAGWPVAIPGRVVYTRFSPRTNLRFAGLKFETELSENAARSIGMDGAPDAVAHTLQALERVEALADEAASAAPHAATGKSIDRDLNTVRRKMDEACADFFVATELFMRSWGETRLRETIAKRHALALAKGATGLRAMKDEWRALEQGMPALVDAQLNRDSLWPHRAETARRKADAEVWFYDIERDRPPARIMNELRKLAGFIGRVIIRHGFEDIGTRGEWTPIAHERALVFFSGKFAVSDAMCDSLKRAAALEIQYRQLCKRSETASDEAMQAQALSLWERA